jgi:hypothetical protein
MWLPEKRNEEKQYTRNRCIPEENRTHKTVSGCRREQISYARPEVEVRTPEHKQAVPTRDMRRKNYSREAAGHVDEIQGVVANMPKLLGNGAVGFIACRREANIFRCAQVPQ